MLGIGLNNGVVILGVGTSVAQDRSAMTRYTPKKVVLAIKLSLVMLLTIVVILCLSFDSAYGAIGPRLNLEKPKLENSTNGNAGEAVQLTLEDEFSWNYTEPDFPDLQPAESNEPACPVPEPSSLLLLAGGLFGLGSLLKRK